MVEIYQSYNFLIDILTIPVRQSGSSNFHDSESFRTGSMRRSADGGLTSSFKTGQSGVKKSVEFDLTGTYQMRQSNR